MNKLLPSAYAFPAIGWDHDTQRPMGAHDYTDQPGLDVEQFAYLLAWQARLIAKAMKDNIDPHAEVDRLFDREPALKHTWVIRERYNHVYGETQRKIACKTCGFEATSERNARDLDAAIQRREAAECPGVKP